jgi:hypothetical protein
MVNNLKLKLDGISGYEVELLANGKDPLICPKCGGTMRIISFIEDREVIQTILKHLGLWLVKSRPTPKAPVPPAGYLRDPFSQLPTNDDPLYCDPDYPWDAYLQS